MRLTAWVPWSLSGRRDLARISPILRGAIPDTNIHKTVPGNREGEFNRSRHKRENKDEYAAALAFGLLHWARNIRAIRPGFPCSNDWGSLGLGLRTRNSSLINFWWTTTQHYSSNSDSIGYDTGFRYTLLTYCTVLYSTYCSTVTYLVQQLSCWWAAELLTVAS